MRNTIKTLLAILALVLSSRSYSQIISIPDSNFKAKLLQSSTVNTIAKDSLGNNMKIDINDDREIQESEALLVAFLEVNQGYIKDLTGINNFTNLVSLVCNANQLTSIDLTGLSRLKKLNCSYNRLTNLNTNGLINLRYLDCSNNKFSNIDVSGLDSLRTLYCDNNLLTSLVVIESQNLEELICPNNQLTNLDINGLNSLTSLNCQENQLISLDLRGLNSLKALSCYGNQLTSLDVGELSNLNYLDCRFNQLKSLDLSGLNKLEELFCSNNDISSLDVSGLSSLITLGCHDNQLSSLDLNSLSNLVELYCGYNLFVSLDISKCVSLRQLECSNCQLTSLNVSGLSNLVEFYCGNNPLQSLYIQNTDIPLLDFSNCLSLFFICLDQEDYSFIKEISDSYGYTQVVMGTFCGGTSGGFYYTLSGKVRYDVANNGCSVQDSVFPYLKIKLENSDASGYTISDAKGVYSLSLPADTFTITPVFENPYFTISPASATIIMPDTTFPNFCITPNGNHHDVTVAIIPTTPARPGFSDATYKIVYTNKGNTTQSGTITFRYDDTLNDFLSSSASPTNTNAGVISFDYSNLHIFESRSIIVTLHTNSPTDVPPVNAGDDLKFIANITGTGTDETIKNNSFSLIQTVVGSFDPNDKTCLQGNIVTPSIIGEYVDYLIRFENTGTAAAENVVITDYIDLSRFDISTLQLTSTSHSCRTAISEGNKVQFIFDKIMLPFTEPDKHGYVAFKIKTLASLAVGDTLSNKADIYFDYNLPIATNTALSLILTPTPVKSNTYNVKLQLMPNPSDGNFVLRLEGKGSLAGQVKIYDLTGAEVYNQAIVHNDISSHSIHADLPNGIYYLQLQSDGNSWTEKLEIGR